MNNHNFKKRLIINKTYKGKLLQRTSCGFSVQQLVLDLKIFSDTNFSITELRIFIRKHTFYSTVLGSVKKLMA